MSDSEKYITVLEGDQLAVAAKALSGSIISEPSKRYITTLVQTDEGVQLAVKAYVLNGGGGGGGDVDYTKIVQKTASMPAASSSNAGYVYMYQGSTNQTYTHGYIYENQYTANYAGTIAFTPAGISVSDEDFSSFLNTWKRYLTTPTLVTNGTITYHGASDLWRMVMKDANNQQIGTLQLYQSDYEASGFTFPADPQDGDTYSFTTTITETSSTYQWVRLNVQPEGSSYTGGTGIGISQQNEISFDPTSITGYDASATQVLQNDQGTNKWGAAPSSGADTSLSNLTAAGKEVAATMSMPSDVVEELSNVATNQLITAPADGYFTVIPTFGAGSTVFVTVKASTATSVDDDSMLMIRMTDTANNGPRCFIPIRKGQKLVVNPATASPFTLRFCYAKGSESQQ